MDTRALPRRHPGLFLLLALLVLPACQLRPAPTATPQATAWPQAEALFRQDPRWLGGDAALSIPLDATRRLWLFGDSFIAVQPGAPRAQAAFIHNSVAVQEGLEPPTARLRFHWQSTPDGQPSAFFAGNGTHWYWPGHGMRIAGGPLLVFLQAITAADNPLGFSPGGFALAIIANPDADPAHWQPRIVAGAKPPFDAVPGAAVLHDGEHAVVLALRQHGVHAGALVRYRVPDLARGDTTQGEWWGGDARGWLPATQLPDGPAWILDDAGSEASLHFEPCLQAFVHVASYGFGSSTLGLRTAPALTGPWSAPRSVYTPPESQQPHALVYAGKAHPDWTAGARCERVLGYVANSLNNTALFTPAGGQQLYWPRLLRLNLSHWPTEAP